MNDCNLLDTNANQTAILPPAQATLLTSKSITASSSASTPPVDPNTSIQGNRNQPPSPSSVPASSSAVATSNTAISTSPVNVQPNGGLTSTLMVSTTATAFISSSASASATTKAPTPANALGETTDAQTSGTPSRDNGLSKGVETVIIVISVGGTCDVLTPVLVFTDFSGSCLCCPRLCRPDALPKIAATKT